MQPIHGVLGPQRDSTATMRVRKVARMHSSSILLPGRRRRPIVDPTVEIANIAAPIEDVKRNGNDQICLADQWLVILIFVGFCLGDDPDIEVVFWAVGSRRKKACWTNRAH